MNRKFVFIIVIESILLLVLAYLYLRVRRVPLADCERFNPLGLAVEYESPPAKFEQLVKANPWWVSYRKKHKFPDDARFPPLLSECATMGSVSYMRILLENGADPEEAITWSLKNGLKDNANLIRQVNKAVQDKTNGIREQPSAVQAQDYTYTTNNEMITITQYIGDGGVVTIPSTIDGLPVASIEDGAFFRLTSVTIPASVTDIGGSAFSGCTSLSTITVDGLNPVYSSVNGVLFNKNQSSLILCPQGKAGSYTIPASVTSIEREAFGNCACLTGVIIPNSIINIGECAFLSCYNLTSVTIPNSVTHIQASAFDSCTILTGVYFQGNAPILGETVFRYANHATVYYLPGATGWGATFGGRPTVLWTNAPSHF